MPRTRPTSTYTLGAALERDRLERRVGRMTLAIDSLRRDAGEDRRRPPKRFRQLIADFDAQIAAMNARLHELVPDSGSTADERLR